MTSETPKPRGLAAAVNAAFGRPGGRPPVTTPTPAAPPAPIYSTRPRRPRPARRVSAIVTLPVFGYHSARQTAVVAERPEDPRGVDVPAGPVVAVQTPATFATLGPEAIIAKLERLGVRFEVTPDRTNVVPLTEAGFMVAELRDAILAALPLVRGHLTGRPLTCGWCGEPAVDIALGGVGLCLEHAVESGVEA